MAKAKSSPPETVEGVVKNYGINIFCTLAQIYTERSFNDVDLDSFLRDVQVNGYADNKPGRTVIYPAHTINKIEVVIQ